MMEPIYSEIGQTIDNKPVYEQKFVKKQPKFTSKDLQESNRGRIEREAAKEFLNRSPIPGESKIIKPVISYPNQTQEYIDFEEDPYTVEFIDDRTFESKENPQPYYQKPQNTSPGKSATMPLKDSILNQNSVSPLGQSKKSRLPLDNFSNNILRSTNDNTTGVYPQPATVDQTNYEPPQDYIFKRSRPTMKEPVNPLFEEAEHQPEPSVIPEDKIEKFEDTLKTARDAEEMVEIFNNEVSALNEQPKAVIKIDDLYKKLVDNMHEKNFKFEDHLFPSNSSSMVNNSRKTKQPYAFNEWKPLHKIYQNTKLLKDFMPQNLFPGGSVPTELAVALSALC